MMGDVTKADDDAAIRASAMTYENCFMFVVCRLWSCKNVKAKVEGCGW